eukprot:1555794-Pyramimonas_sp.AAC.1
MCLRAAVQLPPRHASVSALRRNRDTTTSVRTTKRHRLRKQRLASKREASTGGPWIWTEWDRVPPCRGTGEQD